MITEARDDVISPALLQPTGATILGTTVAFDQFDTTYHWEELLIICHLVAGATAPGTLTLDGVLNLVSNIKLEFNYGGLRTAVNISGIGSLEHAANTGLNLDPGTLALIGEHTKGSAGLTNSNTYRLCYRVPLVHPMVTEPLRTRCLVPVPHHDAPPRLTLTFSSAAAMYGAGSLATVLVQLVPIRREVPAALDAQIMKDGGYIPFDLIENPYQIATGVSGDQHIPINQPGAYASMLLRLYKGGASITRDDMSASTTAGSETIWSLQTGSKIYRRFFTKSLQAQNGWSRVLNNITQTSSPTIFGTPAANTQYGPPNSLMMDFLTGNGIADANELGGVLDCFLPANPGQRMELVFNCASAATNGHTVYLLGHRFLDQALVAKFQKL